jgi:hypothetical protein
MRTRIHFFIILSFLLGISTSIFAQTTLEKKGLKGEVKTMSATTYRSAIEEGKIVLLSVSLLQKATFNEAGYMSTNEYQANTISLGDGPKRKRVFELNKENQTTKETFYKDDVKGRHSEYTYKDGLLAETKYYKEDGTLMGTQYITYDANGNKLMSNATDPKGNTMQKVELTYTKDNKIASAKENKRGKLVRYVKYEYPNEKEEKVIRMDTKAENEETIKGYTVKTYDDNENVLRSVSYDSDGKPGSVFLYEYNEQGENTLKTSTDGEGDEVEEYNYMRYEYKYDEKGNWIEKTEYLKNGNSMDVTKRKIEYYK